jgi:hypothetical protein
MSCTIGLRPKRLRAFYPAQTADENHVTRSDHLFVEHVDIATHRFVLDGRVVVVGVVNSNQILHDDFSNDGVRVARYSDFTMLDEWPDRNSTTRVYL